MNGISSRCLMWVSLWCAAALSPLGLAGESDKAAKSDLADLFPVSAVLYLEAPDMQTAAKLWPETALGKILAEPEVERFLKEPRLRFDKYLTKICKSAPGLKEGLEQSFSRRVAAAVVIDADFRGTGLLAIFDLPDNAAAAKTAKELPAFFKEHFAWDADKGSRSVDGAALYDAEGITISVEQRDNLLIVGVAERGSPLSENNFPADAPLGRLSDFAAARKTLGDKNAAFAFLNASLLFTRIKDIAGTAAVAALGNLGLLDVQSICLAVEMAPPGFVTRGLVQLAAPRRGILSLLKEEPLSGEILAAIPADAVYFTAMKIDLSRLLPIIRDAMVAADVPVGEMDMAMEMAAQQFGVHVERDLAVHFGDEAALVMLPSDNLGGLPFLGLNGLAIIVRIKGQEAIAKSVNALALATSQMASGYPIGGGPLSFTHNGFNVQGARIGEIIAPCLCATDKFLIFTFGPPAMIAVLDAMVKKTPGMADSAALAETMKRFGGLAQSGMAWNSHADISMLSSDLGSASIMAGLLLPSRQSARGTAQKAACINNFKQIGLGIAMHASENFYGKMPEHLKDLYRDGQGIINDPKIFVCPDSGQGYHFIANLPMDAPDDCLVAWDAKGNHQDGRCALYRDSHVRFLREAKFEEELANTIRMLKEKGIEPKILDPWLPPGMPGHKSWQASALNPFAQLEKDPEAFMRELLATFPLYRLPSARTINNHLFAASGVVRVLPEGILMENYGATPLLAVADATFLGGSSISTIVSVLTSPVLYNLLLHWQLR